MYLILCPGCGALRLFHRRPNWHRRARCVRRNRGCGDIEQLQHSRSAWESLQHFALEHRGDRSVRDVLEAWTRALHRLNDLTQRRERLQREHPHWHRLKTLWKARQEQDRARARTRQRRRAADPKLEQRAAESHPRWAQDAARARKALARNTDALNRKPYTRGLQHPRYSAPDWVYGDDPAVYSADRKPTV